MKTIVVTTILLLFSILVVATVMAQTTPTGTSPTVTPTQGSSGTIIPNVVPRTGFGN